MIRFILLVPLALAACGVDGPPRPVVGASVQTHGPRSATGTDVLVNIDNQTGVSVSGEARMGVVGRL
ncbi:hypothetical protein [Halodurantibacterium flavum]|uniref:Argininosuccinate lyase n=1 Tax=Halodurantibacterium flavum TaxID=1382802 RepID=A0ABW4S936_9RHOB